MITNPEWLKPKEKPYFHQISMDCIEKLVDCMEGIDIEDMDCVTCFKMQEMLNDEIDDPEFLNFAIDNISELLSYIESGRVNVRIHRDITGLPPIASLPLSPALREKARNGGGCGLGWIRYKKTPTSLSA